MSLQSDLANEVDTDDYPLPVIDKQACVLINKMVSALDANGISKITMIARVFGTEYLEDINAAAIKESRMANGILLKDHASLVLESIMKPHIEATGEQDIEAESNIHTFCIEKDSKSLNWALLYSLDEEFSDDVETQYSYTPGDIIELVNYDTGDIIDFMSAYGVEVIRTHFEGSGDSGEIISHEYLDINLNIIKPPVETIIDQRKTTLKASVANFAERLAQQLPNWWDGSGGHGCFDFMSAGAVTGTVLQCGSDWNHPYDKFQIETPFPIRSSVKHPDLEQSVY